MKRYLANEVQQIVTTVRNESLPLPVVKLQVDNHRRDLSAKKIVEVEFDAHLNRKRLPIWSFVTGYASDVGYSPQWITTNVVNWDYLAYENLSVEAVKSAWPLKTQSSMSFPNGLIIEGNHLNYHVIFPV